VGGQPKPVLESDALPNLLHRDLKSESMPVRARNLVYDFVELLPIVSGRDTDLANEGRDF
jgi:hypothetical protein